MYICAHYAMYKYKYAFTYLSTNNFAMIFTEKVNTFGYLPLAVI